MTTPDSDSTVASAPSVLLNRPHALNANRPPVWPLNESLGPLTPLPSKCAREEMADGICCKELRGDDERTLIDPDVVRDVSVVFFFLFCLYKGLTPVPLHP